MKTEMNFRRTGAAALSALMCVTVAGAGTAGASETGPGNYRYYHIDEGDYIINYDNHTKSGANSGNADWPVTLVFWNYAEVDKIKDETPGYHFGSQWAGTKYLYLKDGGSYEWDRDDGLKTDIPSCTGDTRHFRLYADPDDDENYSVNYGWYVVGTTHKDYNETCPNKHFGQSEQTERDLADRFRDKGWRVDEDYSWMDNYEKNCPRSTNSYKPSCPGRPDAQDGSYHQWQSSGYATYIRVPK